MKYSAYIPLASQSSRRMNYGITTRREFATAAGPSLWFRSYQFGMTSSRVEESSLIEVGQPVKGVYEAMLPPTETLVGMGLVLILCIVCAWYWTEKVVPVSRTNLAISKSRGEVKEYLDELRSTAPKLLEKTNANSKDLTSVHDATDTNKEDVHNNTTDYSNTVFSSRSSQRAFERWLFTDWLIDNKSERRAGRQKEPAIPILREAKWNSGDNPVVVAAALMVLGLLLTAVNENISTW
jgi:hypothetical protein